MNDQEAALWERIESFSIGETTAVFGFHHRLARENGWTYAFAEKVIEEYKRFMFLAVCADHPVTPSEEVDQAWHLHLVYTHSYWEEFCRDILGKPIHHGPTKGGIVEADRFEDWYSRTLESYERLFGEKPPEDVWPTIEKRFLPRKWQWIDRRSHWILRRPRFFDRITLRGVATLIASLLPVLLLTGCVGNVLNWYGTPFLLLYLALLPAALVLALSLSALARPSGRYVERFDSPYELAFLRGGQPRAFAAMLGKLVAVGAITVSKSRRSGGWIRRAEDDIDHSENLTLEEQRMLSAIPMGKEISLKNLSKSVGTIFDEIKERLIRGGALISNGGRAFVQFLMSVPFVLLALLGVLKIGIGISRDKPCLYLLILVVLTFVAMTFVVKKAPRRTREADRFWKRARKPLQSEARQNLSSGSEAAVPVAVAVLGTSAVSNIEGFEDFHPAVRYLEQQAARTTTGDGGCGSGCGGGGCGGGCGGCGG